MTTRSRFALVLGVAGLAVAGVQLAMISDPPTVVQLLVLSFWSVVGVAYLVSAVGQILRGRLRRAPDPVPAPVEEIVPVPVRPARPRPRPSVARADPAPVADDAPKTSRVSIRARRPVPRGAATTATTAAVPRPSASPVPAPPPEDTTDAFTVRAAARLSPKVGPARKVAPAPRKIEIVPTSGPAPTGLASALSFGAPPQVPVTDVDEPPAPTSIASLDDLRRVRAEAEAAAAISAASAPAPRSPSPVSGPLPVATSAGRPGGSRGSRHAAAPGTVPEPRARHRADAEDPVGTRRGRPEPEGGRHASGEIPVPPRRAATGR